MSVRQRIRTTLKSQGTSGVCWRCALGFQRHISLARKLGLEIPRPSVPNGRYKSNEQSQRNGNSQPQRIRVRDIHTNLRSRKDSKRDGHYEGCVKTAQKNGYQRYTEEKIMGLRENTLASLEHSPRSYPRALPSQSTSGSLRSPSQQGSTKAKTRRGFHATAYARHMDPHSDSSTLGLDARLKATLESGSIRSHLKLWQELQDSIAKFPTSTTPSSVNLSQTGGNLFTQSGDDDSFKIITPEHEADDLEDDDYERSSSDEQVPDVLRKEAFLRKGDLVEVSSPMGFMLAIFVRNLMNQSQFYTMRGEWLHRETELVRFSVPRFVHPDELKDVLPYLPSAEVSEEEIDRLQPMDVNAPRDAGAKLLEKMSAFHRSADKIFRQNADRLNRVYEIIAPPKRSTGKTAMTLGQIAITVLQKTTSAALSPAMMWAVHKAVMQTQNVAHSFSNNRQNPLYQVEPQEILAELVQVREWVRDYQENIIENTTESFDTDAPDREPLRSANPIATLVSKARVAIDHSRRTRVLAPNGCLGPSSEKVAPTESAMKNLRGINVQQLSHEERIIIHYLDAWVLSRNLNIYTNWAALGPLILRAVGKYDGFKLDETIGFTFLKEIGVISPWENREIYRLTNLRLPGHGDGSEAITRLRNEAYKEFASSEESALLKDSMEELRHDWADLPVFCIDSADTLERDDGVSVKDVEGSNTEYWVHIHVANPSAFISPDSATGRYAAQLSATVYLPDMKYPMLHPSLTSKYLSLARGRPCLTFSARMTLQGDLLESMIRPGIVHNVHHVTPFEVGREIGINEAEPPEAVSLLTVGGYFPDMSKKQADHSQQPLAQCHIDMLRKLRELGEAARRRRTLSLFSDQNAVTSSNTSPKVFLGPHAEPFQVRDESITNYASDPIIGIERTAGRDPVSGMVADLMILAGEISASWCKERNIPVPYRGIARNPEPASSPELYREEIIDRKVAKYGHVPLHDLRSYIRLLGQIEVSPTPLEHLPLGLSAYCKATSPLRRYDDMYTHWQIEAALRQEAKTGTSLIGSNDDSYLPFSRSAVQQYTSTARYRERKIMNTSSGSIRHWITQALFRAYYFKEAPLPETFEVTALSPMRGRQNGVLNEWNIRVNLFEGDAVIQEGGIKLGDIWEAKIQDINTYHQSIWMEPFRLIERGADVS